MKRSLLFSIILTTNIYATTISKIVISGNTKTKESVIRNEIDFKIGQEVNQKQLEEAKIKLRNTNLFSSVKIRHHKNTVYINVIDRWTTIPILKFSSGGGVTKVTAGVFDPNIFGEYIEAGAQFDRLEDTNSGVVWFKNPRLFGKRYGIDLQAWKINRLRTKFDQRAEDPVVLDGFLHIRDKFYLGLTKEFHSKLKTTVFYEYNRDKFSTKLVPKEAKSVSQSSKLPVDTKYHFAGAQLDLGRLDSNSFLLDGSKFTINARIGTTSTNKANDFFSYSVAWNYFKSFGDHTFAQRIMAGGTDTKVLQYWYYLGGLDRIRGFSDNRFAGRYFWLSNSEYRIPLIQRPSWILQSVGFLDITSTKEVFGDLSDLSGASTGLGLRVVLPKIYRFVIRLDYAKPIYRDDDNSISFGVQQFF